MLAFFSVAPMDHWQHMSSDVAQALRVLEKSGLQFQLGPNGTDIEGDPEDVFEAMKQMHLAIRKNSKRVSTLIKIDDQVDRPLGRIAQKVQAVQEKM